MAKKRSTPKTSNANRTPNKGGRPPTYNPDIHPQVAKALCAKGATVAELADAFDVAISTIWQWKINHPAFFESCRLGTTESDDPVERSFYERAVGYTFDAVKVMVCNGACARCLEWLTLPTLPAALCPQCNRGYGTKHERADNDKGGTGGAGG